MQLKRSYMSFVTPALLGAGASGGTASWSSPKTDGTRERVVKHRGRRRFFWACSLGMLSVATGEAAPRRCVSESGELRRRIRTGQLVVGSCGHRAGL